jgi:signal transduction histidine kinase
LLDRLSESVDRQRAFHGGASHELRTPVTVARTAAQVTLSEPHRSEPEYREALDIVASQADRLTHVVDDMFLLALADVEGRPLLRRHLTWTRSSPSARAPQACSPNRAASASP